MAARGEFSSRTAFVLAASGSAIGLGNIWGFPIKVASNGGGAFVFTYIILTFLLAYPILMAELVIGRYAKSDTVRSITVISNQATRPLAFLTGYWGMLTASLILSFYAIVAGWMVSHGIGSLFDVAGQTSTWFITESTTRSLLFSAIFYALTVSIVARGVASGIEKWSTRLMPILILLIIALIVYISTQAGAAEGWRVYLQPDFSKVLEPSLVLGIAVLAGMLVIPAMYVAQHNGVVIYDDAGKLIESGRLIFNVLPSLFETMGAAGTVVSLFFFALMSIAALTSSISMLEVPVAYATESHGVARSKAAWLVGACIFVFSVLIIFNASWLFDWVVQFATEFSEPVIGILFCLFVGWVWRRDQILQEMKEGNPQVEQTFFWKIWPTYVKFVCPLVVIGLLTRSFGLLNF